MKIRYIKKEDWAKLKRIDRAIYGSFKFEGEGIPQGKGLVAIENDQIIGFIFAETTKHDDVKILYVSILDVVAKARGKGVGRALLENLLDRLSYKYDLIWLKVEKKNKPAINLYKSSGFKIANKAQLQKFKKLGFSKAKVANYHTMLFIE